MNKPVNGKHLVPRKRKVVQTIKLNNGLLTYEIDDFSNGYWFRNGKYITPSALMNYRFYDPSIKSYRYLKGPFTFPYTPNLDKIDRLAKSDEHPSLKDFSPSKETITLRTKGKMNLAEIPVNLLDTIAINTGRSNTDIKTNLGLVGKESTFGGFSSVLGNEVGTINTYNLVNNHAYTINPYRDYNAEVRLRLNNVNFSAEALVKEDKKAKYALEHGGIKERTPHYHANYLADAFLRYLANPAKYNPGQKNYTSMVTSIGNEVWNEPQILKWWKNEGIKYYQKGLGNGN